TNIANSGDCIKLTAWLQALELMPAPGVAGGWLLNCQLSSRPRGCIFQTSFPHQILLKPRTAAWPTQVADHLVPNRVLGILQNFKKVYFGKGFGMRELPKLFSAQIQRI